ncbi:GbsR/MarR family transcriptional regulator [Segeticoccus rhizosphaerae]|uniref:GbsR/MarR family transcriptional regulator n=1 Tax=Segeticoccus rhizosphaerae TaxID=1104777 RepID=UPI0010C0FA9E|nr:MULTISPECIES: MarR family transcriptional regulator [Intrasporangiaceae]
MTRRDQHEARAAVIERVSGELVAAGMQRMAARAFVAVLTSDDARMTAAEVGEVLQASPAAVSGAMRYLEQVDMIRRSREPGSRRDVFSLGDDVWYEALGHKDGVIDGWQRAMAEGASTLGLDTAAGRRLDETREFFAFVGKEMPILLERWRAHRATLPGHGDNAGGDST